MKLSKQDWLKLRLNIGFLWLIVCLVALLLGWMHHYRLEQAQALAIQKRLLARAERDYLSLKNEQALRREYGPHYQTMLAQAKRQAGLLYPSNRLHWVSQLQTQQKNYQLFTINYNIGLSESFKSDLVSDMAGLLVHSTRITLTFDMLHEEDLLLLTEALSANNSNAFVWRDCEINRPEGGVWLRHRLSANLQAKCALDSLTLTALSAKPSTQP